MILQPLYIQIILCMLIKIVYFKGEVTRIDLTVLTLEISELTTLLAAPTSPTPTTKQCQ